MPPCVPQHRCKQPTDAPWCQPKRACCAGGLRLPVSPKAMVCFWSVVSGPYTQVGNRKPVGAVFAKPSLC